ncbi:universal stress protein [Qaidamihabitans albus]|uniref:universal stress protein n=1 Tax=Qaidamihabitans albus TaxID=2795733 RepID=UPI0018F1A15A|nr:universal stress protein [Qaidamihabitans albus]
MRDVDRAIYNTVAAALYSERERGSRGSTEPAQEDGARSRPVVVAVDGSAAAREATRWAAREAARLGAPLRLTHVCDLPPFNPRARTPLPRSYEDALVESGHEWLREAAADAAEAAPGVDVDWDVRVGRVVDVLVEESAGARMLAVGSRGLGGFRRMLVGSVAMASAAHAHSPVVVVREGTVTADGGHVVVGVDASATSGEVLSFAFDQAAARRARLIAVRAWRVPSADAAWDGLAERGEVEAIGEAETHSLRQELTGWREKYPDVEVSEAVVRADRAADALLGAARHAQLIVVGSHGHGPVAGILLGSTSRTLLHHAPCPVAVVRSPR